MAQRKKSKKSGVKKTAKFCGLIIGMALIVTAGIIFWRRKTAQNPPANAENVFVIHLPTNAYQLPLDYLSMKLHIASGWVKDNCSTTYSAQYDDQSGQLNSASNVIHEDIAIMAHAPSVHNLSVEGTISCDHREEKINYYHATCTADPFPNNYRSVRLTNSDNTGGMSCSFSDKQW